MLAAGLPGAGSASAPNIYASIGVRPLINCRGVITIIGGSLMLPEVKRAMEDASRHYVHLDELMDAVGKRLAELTGAGWGIVTAGCAAALTHATSACIASADPERLQRLPDLTGLKNEVIMPSHCRNIYDQAVRMLGVKVVEVETPEQLDAAFHSRTAMIYFFENLAGLPGERGPLTLRVVAEAARKSGVPVLVDAAADELTVPNVLFENGATLVAYSGGKPLRGPQCAGLLLGRKDLVRAAWLNSAPHHSFGRSMKVGKEEIMGMLAAVEMWFQRDHKAEWKQWDSWVNHIAGRLGGVDGVTAEVVPPRQGLTNRCPNLRIEWDGARLGITGQEVEKLLWQTEPRIALAGATGNRREGMASSVSIRPFMMSPGEEKIVADRLYSVLSKPPRTEVPSRPGGPSASVAGRWNAKLEFECGTADHAFFFEQQGTEVRGTHRGDMLAGDLRGTVEGNEIWIRSSQKYEGARIGYEFLGTVAGNTMQGVVGLGEYGQARWTAERHRYGEPGGLVRPVKSI